MTRETQTDKTVDAVPAQIVSPGSGLLGDIVRWMERRGDTSSVRKDGATVWSCTVEEPHPEDWPVPVSHRESLAGFTLLRRYYHDASERFSRVRDAVDIRVDGSRADRAFIIRSYSESNGEETLGVLVFPTYKGFDQELAKQQSTQHDDEVELREDEDRRMRFGDDITEHYGSMADFQTPESRRAQAAWIADDATRQSRLNQIFDAARAVRKDLAAIGDRAHYLWPGAPATTWKGFSYEIPKEEQIRSAFWAHLHDAEELVCELEWVLYQQKGNDVRAGGEIDLVGFRVRSKGSVPALLLEFKRVWMFDHWVKKPEELRRGLEMDCARLTKVVKVLREVGDGEELAGVVVAGFAERGEDLDALVAATHPKLDEYGFKRMTLIRDVSPLCYAPVSRDRRVIEVPVFMRLDLLYLD